MPLNRHQFQFAARQFRAGKISLNDFTDQVYSDSQSTDADTTESDNVTADESTTTSTNPDRGNICRQLSMRASDSHKGDYGRVLCIGGSVGMTGAISMTGVAALRSGAGLVTVAVPEPVIVNVAGFSPCLMTIPLRENHGRVANEAVEAILSIASRFDVIAIGPGMGRSKSVTKFVSELVRSLECPLVVDADGLNAIADSDSTESFSDQCLFTPHPGEFARLTGQDFSSRKEIESAAVDYAKLHHVVVLLKGSKTLITDGKRQRHNTTGNPGMATGGSGDVLTGIVTALVGQGLSLFDAAVYGAEIHGRAGDIAARELGQVSMIATDIIDYLPSSFKNS